MAVSLSRKRSSKPAKDVERQGFCCLCNNILCALLFRIPAAIFLLILIFLWSSSTTIISGKIVHVCVSSRKLSNLYCVSAGAQSHRSFELPIPILSNINSTNLSTAYGKAVVESKVAGENLVSVVRESLIESNLHGQSDADAMKAVEEQLEVQRSWISHSTNGNKCEGRGIFVYDLPTKFNKDLLARCSDMIPWMNFCKYLENEAMGPSVPVLGSRWFQTHQYSLEPIFHSRVLKHPCRVYNENEAKLFYVPFYGGFDILRWHFNNVSNEVKDSLGLELMDWLGKQRAWIRNSGKDHVFVLGKISWDFRRNNFNSWGTRFLELEQMQNPVKLLIERQPWRLTDIGIPHPTGFHPHSDGDIISWQQKIISSWRRNLVSFIGAARPGATENIRSVLIKQCTSAQAGECRFLDCRSGGCDQLENVTQTFMESEFCLQPPGDSPTRKSLFDSLISGCIPVLFDPFTAYYQYTWHLPEDPKKFSVFIDKEEVRQGKVNVIERLMKITKQERDNMRIYIIYEIMPGLVYGDSTAEFKSFQDAFSITINNLLEMVSRSQ